MRWFTRLMRIFLSIAVLSILSFVVLLVITPNIKLPDDVVPLPMINDVTGMNPIHVVKEVAPSSIKELQSIVREHDGPISIGGGRYSMGGQIGADESLHIDMRKLDHIVKIDRDKKEIIVEAGATWRSIQEAIDPLDLSIKVMQSYANFTVGGSLSVNVHGRYIGEGPIIGTVRSIRVVLADGQLIDADREKNSEIFYGCIGGYGALGVIAEATLDLADNTSIIRVVETVPLKDYGEFFRSNIRDNRQIVFQNGDLLPDEKVYSVSWRATKDPLTVETRLTPQLQRPTLVERLIGMIVLDVPFGIKLRQYLEPFRYRDSPVVKRNFEAGYDVSSLGTISTPDWSFVLQEYFVPVERVESFARAISRILAAHSASVANISIRHALPDKDSFLSWAPEEMFAFVLYYRQGTSVDARREVGTWTREIIDAALAMGGTYYLPYQPQALKGQFARAYPRAGQLFSLKDRIDPTYKFHNRLWDAYYRLTADREIYEATTLRKAYFRPEVQTYLTVPEWSLVFFSEDLGKTVASAPQSSYAFLKAAGQFWYNYAILLKLNFKYYSINWGYHFMNTVIGLNTSAEYLAKSLYENTVGRLTEWVSGTDGPPREGTIDAFIRDTYVDYAAFIHEIPWYQYPFVKRLQELWGISTDNETSLIRHYERKVSFSVELAVKALLGKLFGIGTASIYEAEDLQVGAVVKAEKSDIDALLPEAVEITSIDSNLTLLNVPRYEKFTQILKRLVASAENHELVFLEIAGNKRIAVSVIAPLDWKAGDGTVSLFESPLIQDRSKKRVGIVVPVPRLITTLRQLQNAGISIEHVFDY